MPERYKDLSGLVVHSLCIFASGLLKEEIMLSDTLREGAHGRIFKILFWIIILSFVFAGVGNYLIPKLNTDPVKIGDFKVSSQDWTEQYNRRTQDMQRTYGPQATELLEDKNVVKALHMQVLESMIDSIALNAATYDQGIRIGDDQVKDNIRRNPVFFKDGKFNNDLYLASVRNIGASPEYYAEQVRIGLLADSIRVPVTQLSSIPMPYELSAISKLFSEQRSVDLYTLNPVSLKDKVKVSDDEIKAYYDAHHNEFMDPASVRFNYVVISLEDLKKSITVDDKTAEDYYNMHQDEFTYPEERECSHILVKKSDEQQKTVAAIEQGLKDGKSFEELAKEYSDDANTKNDGGVMGKYQKGKLAANLDAALFELKNVGDVSKVIYDQFGAHFIKLTGITVAHVPAFKDIKDDVVKAAVNEQARKDYDEKVQTLTDVSFENPDSLDATAKALNVDIKDSGDLIYGDTKAPWPLNTQELQKAAFKEENRTSGTNSQAISLSDEAAAVINVSSYKEAKLVALDNAREKAQELAYESKAVAEADKILSEFANAVVADENAAVPSDVTVRKDVLISRSSQDISPEFSQNVFAMPKDEGKAYTIGTDKGNAVLAVLKKVGEDSSAQEAGYENFIASQLVQIKGGNATNMLYKGARELQKIEYNDDAINMVIQQDSSEK